MFVCGHKLPTGANYGVNVPTIFHTNLTFANRQTSVVQWCSGAVARLGDARWAEANTSRRLFRRHIQKGGERHTKVNRKLIFNVEINPN